MTAEFTRQLLGYYSNAYPYPAALAFNRRLSLAQVRQRWRTFLRESPFGGDVGMHVHIPFCRHRCTYCDCSSQLLGSPTRLGTHLERLEAEMQYFRSTFRGVRMKRLYVGGGTPNLLTPKQIKRLAARIDECFRMGRDAVRCIEFAPELTRDENVEAAVAGGFNRLSFGVQSLNPRVLSAVERPSMSAAKAGRAVRMARAAGVPEINVDLIFGLAGERTGSFHRGLEQVCAWGAQTVTVQLLSNSELGKVYRSRNHERAVARRFVRYAEQLQGELSADLPHYRLAMRPRTLVLMRNTWDRPWDSWLDFYSGQDRVVTSTLGLGTFAHSYLHAFLHLQNMDQLPDFDPEARLHPSRRYTPEAQVAIEAASALMNEGGCDVEVLRRRYGLAVEPLVQELEGQLARGRLARGDRGVVVRGGRKNPLLSLVRRLSGSAAEDSSEDSGEDAGEDFGGDAGEPVGQAQPQRAGLEVRFRLGASLWFVMVEPANPERRYFTVVDGVGLYYGAHGEWDEAAEQPLGQLMEIVAQRLTAARIRGDNVMVKEFEVRRLIESEFARRGWNLE